MGEVFQAIERTDGTQELVRVNPGDRIAHFRTGCTKCIFVQEKQDILTFHADILVYKDKKFKKHEYGLTFRETVLARLGLLNLEDKILHLGYFTMPGWAGHAMFYAFRCFACGQLAVDYGQGYNLHLNCGHCGQRYDLESPRFYIEAGLPPKPGFWEQVKQINEIRRRIKAEDKKRLK